LFLTRAGDALGLLLCAGDRLGLRLSAGEILRLRLPRGEPLLLRLPILGLRLPAGEALRLRDGLLLPAATGEALRLLPDTEGLRLLISAGAALGLLLLLPLLLRAGEPAWPPVLAGEPLGDLEPARLPVLAGEPLGDLL